MDKKGRKKQTLKWKRTTGTSEKEYALGLANKIISLSLEASFNENSSVLTFVVSEVCM